MKRTFMHLLVAAILVLALGNGSLHAQATASGTVVGTIFDKSQAVVMGAEVVITSKATGTTRTATTNDAGNYRFDLLSAGVYTVRVSKQGFSSLVETVELLVGQTTTVNATLDPGAVATIIEVTGSAPLVDLASTSVSRDYADGSRRTPHGWTRRGQPRVSGPRRQSYRFLRSNQEPLCDSLRER